ncbi:acetate--CoA ligase family protein [Labrenzia sp. PHM005]|uniref:acetate--CoA ligase family protein n=1 Tax=Labrenzia sp. PHM005 TaxID=2590016 RepID=UPI00113FDA79|nr:acetate--CoA ligase family protein [Labrenzia sp. PHM005]QDG75009.1 acetate--CoA ligase family protein [Labrenzia sp. PHM005]
MADVLTPTTHHSLDALLKPKSVAIIGASDDPNRIGGRPVQSTLAGGFKGQIYPVNPKRSTVQGLTAYPSITDVPEPVDCAIVAVPAPLVASTVADCAARGTKTTIVFSSGFAELGEDGAAMQDRIAATAKDAGMRLIGPNCIGAFSVSAGWFGTFSSVQASLRLAPGKTAIISQSGAYGAHMFYMAQRRGVATDMWVTTGNEADIDVAEVIAYYAKHPDVSTIMAYTEGAKDKDRICEALDLARAARKPVIMIKVGDTDVGAAAAATHTASLAGDDAIYDALFEQYGVYRAQSCQEMVDVAYACQTGIFPKGRKMAIQTVSGGVGIQMADETVKNGLDVPAMPEDLQKKLLGLIPYAGVRNPIDITGQVLNQPEVIGQGIDLSIRESGCDAFATYLASAPQSPGLKDFVLKTFKDLRDKHPDTPMALSMIATPEIIETYEALNIGCYEDPVMAIRAVAALAKFHETFERGRPQPAPALPKTAAPVPDNDVSEAGAKAILSSAGIPVTRDILVASAEEAVTAWHKIGGPVVLKIASPDILHKTEIGGVLVGLNTEAAISEGFDDILTRARAAHPDANIEGILVCEMVSGGVETVLGVTRDPVLGPAVMFGLGGIFVEVMKDVTFRLAPFGIDEAHRMIDGIKGRAMLDGVRGAPPADLDALAEALSRLSVFAAANSDRLESIDINPFVVLPKGAVALDAVIVPRSPEPQTAKTAG